MDPGTYDFAIERGATPTIVFEFGSGTAEDFVPLDLAGYGMVLTATWRNGSVVGTLTLSADDRLVLDEAAGRLTWAVTLEESRQIPTGRLTRYTIEGRPPSGGQVPLLKGMITGTGGDNDD